MFLLLGAPNADEATEQKLLVLWLEMTVRRFTLVLILCSSFSLNWYAVHS
jgi:hypothetical protein